MRNLLLYFALIFLFTSCEKEDVAIKLPPPGNLQLMTANMGSYYDNQVYVDFETGSQKTVPYRLYDLAFEASPAGYRIYLNTGKFMFVATTASNDLALADSTAQLWQTEPDNLYDDSTAFSNLNLPGNTNAGPVYIIDRGRTEHFGSTRWRKMQVLWVNATEYRIRFSMYNNTQVTEFTIPKNPDYSLMYFSFENNGKMVEVAPKKNNWDVVFTKYTHIYLSEAVNSPYRFYLVCGALLNRWSENENAIAKKDSTPLYKPFTDITAADIGNFNFSKNAAEIGFEWKNYDFNLGYTIYPDKYYMLKDPSGYYYKIRFIDFYDDQGNKGAATFEYQRI